MKRKVCIILLITMIVGETIVLFNQNLKIQEKNNNIKHQLEENNLVINNEVSLEKIKKEKQSLEETVLQVFQNENIKDVFASQKEKNEELKEEIKKLEGEVTSVETTLSKLQKEYNDLYNKYEKNNSFYITNYPFINQYPDYPTGCESVAITSLLNYYGILVTPDNIIEALPKGSTPYYKNGIAYGGNPEIEFVGNPYSLNSFGLYEKPIAAVANKYKPNIKIATGTSFEDVLNIVRKGTPVMVWTSMYLATPYISTSWIYEPTGEKIYWKANEHAVVIIGYTPTQVIIADPIGGKMKYQSKSIFKERYNYYGKKALYY